MLTLLIRLAVLLVVSLLIYLIVWSGRRYVESQRRRALAAAPQAATDEDHLAELSSSQVRILAFSSEDCSQCHTLQAPALKRVLEKYSDRLTVVEVDAPREPELTERYRVLTVPTTVVLDAAGRAHAVNYGFANAPKLIAQVNEVLTMH